MSNKTTSHSEQVIDALRDISDTMVTITQHKASNTDTRVPDALDAINTTLRDLNENTLTGSELRSVADHCLEKLGEHEGLTEPLSEITRAVQANWQPPLSAIEKQMLERIADGVAQHNNLQKKVDDILIDIDTTGSADISTLNARMQDVLLRRYHTCAESCCKSLRIFASAEDYAAHLRKDYADKRKRGVPNLGSEAVTEGWISHYAEVNDPMHKIKKARIDAE